MEEGRHSRGYLPHVEVRGVAQFVTWRLADALPASALAAMKAKAEALPEGERKAKMSRQIEAYCDAGCGECLLRDSRVARLAQESLFAHHGSLYRLHAWSIMPNHVHALLTPLADVSSPRRRTGSRAARRGRSIGSSEDRDASGNRKASTAGFATRPTSTA